MTTPLEEIREFIRQRREIAGKASASCIVQSGQYLSWGKVNDVKVLGYAMNNRLSYIAESIADAHNNMPALLDMLERMLEAVEEGKIDWSYHYFNNVIEDCAKIARGEK